MIRCLSILLLCLVASGCGNGGTTVLPPQQYVQWFEKPENGLRVQGKSDDYEFELQYQTIEYLVALEQRRNTLEKKILDIERKERAGLQYYKFIIKTKEEQTKQVQTNVNNKEEEVNMMSYYSFELQKDLLLIDGKDSLTCKLCHFIPSYNISNTNTFLLGFDTNDSAFELPILRTKKLRFNGQNAGLPDMELIIKKEAFSGIPEMALN